MMSQISSQAKMQVKLPRALREGPRLSCYTSVEALEYLKNERGNNDKDYIDEPVKKVIQAQAALLGL